MRLYLIRHGAAMERDEALEKKIDDSQRPLVSKGREKNLQLLQCLKGQGIVVELMAVSPFLRAEQSAAQYKELVRGPISSGVVELIPSAPPQAFVQWLKVNAKSVTACAVVGHEPQLSNLASWLLAGAMESFFDLKKSGCICLEVESLSELGPRGAILKWVMGPKQMAEIKS